MGTNQHTPGPWEANRSDIGVIGISRPLPDWPAGFHDKIAECVMVRNREENSANARLIAEAPAMLILLAEAISRVDDLVNTLGKGIIEVEDLAAWSDDVRAILARIDRGQN